MEKRIIVSNEGQIGNLVEISGMNAAVDLLNNIIEANRGIIKVYQTAVERLENEINRELLQEYVEQHTAFIAELSNVVVGLSGRPATHSKASSAVKRAWVTLKAAVTEGDGPILAEAATDAETVLEAYGDAMGADLSDDVRELIRRHMSEVRLAHEKLSALSAAYNG